MCLRKVVARRKSQRSICCLQHMVSPLSPIFLSFCSAFASVYYILQSAIWFSRTTTSVVSRQYQSHRNRIKSNQPSQPNKHTMKCELKTMNICSFNLCNFIDSIHLCFPLFYLQFQCFQIRN